jgi:hypothetical protein
VPIHVPEDGSDDDIIEILGGKGIDPDIKVSYENVVKKNSGGYGFAVPGFGQQRFTLKPSDRYCFVLNRLFAALLRSLPNPFHVSECGSRVYPARTRDPAVSGWCWMANLHVVLFVDVEGGERYLADVGFGGGASPYPFVALSGLASWQRSLTRYRILLRDGQVVPSLTKTESFKIRREILPGADRRFMRDLPEGWTVYRHFPSPSGTDSIANPDSGYWSPLYHITPVSLTDIDFEVANFFTSRNAPFGEAMAFVCSRLVKGKEAEGWRKTFFYDGKAGEGKKARLFTREGVAGKIVEERTVEPRRGEVFEVLRKEFDFH